MPTSDLAQVSRSLRTLLLNNIDRLSGGGTAAAKVTIGYPEDQSGATRTINLHLYHVAEDQFGRNLPGPSGNADVASTPMSLSLFYLVTAHHSSNTGKAEVEQTIMGQALKTMHDFALVRADTAVSDAGGTLHPVLLAGLDDGTTTLEIILRPLTPEDALTYWASEQQQAVRLAAYYEVRLVQLEPEAPLQSAPPVLRVGQWVGPTPAVTIANSRSAIQFARPPAVGNTLPEMIELSPARPFLDLPPIDPMLTENNQFWLTGTGFTAGIRRRVIIAHSDFADLGLPKGEIALVSAAPPMALADARWGVAFTGERIDLAVCPRLANPLGGAPIALMPGTYTARIEVVIADQQVGTTMREVVRRSNDVAFQLAPRLRDTQPPVPVAGDPWRQRIMLRLAPTFSLPAADSVELAIDGVAYKKVAAFAGAAADNDRCFRLLASRIEFQPDFDVTLPGLRIVRVVVNGVDSQPFWLETGP